MFQSPRGHVFGCAPRPLEHDCHWSILRREGSFHRCYGIQRLESLSESHPEVDSLLADLRRRLGENADRSALQKPGFQLQTQRPELTDSEIDRIAASVADKLRPFLDAKPEGRSPRDFGGGCTNKDQS